MGAAKSVILWGGEINEARVCRCMELEFVGTHTKATKLRPIPHGPQHDIGGVFNRVGHLNGIERKKQKQKKQHKKQKKQT